MQTREAEVRLSGFARPSFNPATPRLAFTRAAAAVGVAIAAFGVVLYATARGLGMSPDSVAYWDAARHLRAGEGLVIANLRSLSPQTVPLTHFPPLVSVAMSLISARVLNGLSLAVAAVLMFVLAGARVWQAGFLAALLLLVAPDLILLHSIVLSEPLFLAVFLAWIVATISALDSDRGYLLVVAGALGAAASLIRYAGVALPLTLGALLVLRGRRTAGVLCALSGLAPVVLWLARNWTLQQTTIDRRFALMLPSFDVVLEGLRTAAFWQIAEFAPHPLRLLGELGAVVLVGFTVRGLSRSGERDAIIEVGLIVSAVYIAIVFAAIATVEPTTTLGPRVMSPIHLVVIAAAARVIASRLREYGGRARAAVVISALALLTATGSSAFRQAARSRQDPGGFASRVWRDSPLMKATTFVPLDAILATNAAEAVLLNTNRRALATAVFDRGLLPPVSVSNDRARRTGVFLALFSGMPGAGDVRREYRDAGWRLVVDSSYVDGVMLRAYPPAATH